MIRHLPPLFALLPLVACSEGPGSNGEPAVAGSSSGERRCKPTGQLVATDIDGTLTISHEEWERQLDDPAYDQEMRPDANTLMQGYAELGYTIVYITARWSGFDLSDGRSSTEATLDWLEDHDFPVKASRLYLAPTEDGSDAAVIDYKSDVLEDLVEDRGATLAYAYGNADTDDEAFLEAGFDAAHVFHVEGSGNEAVETLSDDDAYTDHLDDHLPGVPDVSNCR